MTKKKKRKTKAVVELASMKFKCSNYKEEIVIKATDLGWYGRSDLCELCGSHGSIEVNFKCLCGERHHMELDSW